MTLQDFYFLTGSMAFIFITIYIIVVILLIAFLADKIISLIGSVKKIIDSGAKATSEVKDFVVDVIYLIRRIIRIGG